MSKLLDRCKQCVDSNIINWEKTKLSTEEKRTIEEYECWGMVRLALYVLNTDEYFEFKQYIYDTYGYDSGGCDTGQITLDDVRRIKNE